jgi:hypothetical protein
MADYISPGDAFTSGLNDFYARQQAAELAQERERRQTLKDQMEMEQAKAALEEKRRAFDETRLDKRKAAFEKTVSGMVKGDIPTPELLQEAKELGYTHLFPSAPVITTPPSPEPPASIALPEAAPAPATAPEGIRPPLVGGFRFAGTKEERLEEVKKAKIRAIQDKLAKATPGSPEERAAILEYEMEANKSIPAGFAKTNHDTKVGTFEDYVIRSYGMNPTPKQLETARKTWGEEGRQAPGEGVPHYQLQPELDDNGKPTGKYYGYNSKTNKFELVEGVAPKTTKTAPGAGPLALEEHKKQSAVNTLNQLDRMIDQAAEFVGPGAGRVTSIEQMVGSANPKAHSLATKMLLAKMKIDAAIGGVRAAASPQLLQRWDNILGLHTNADSLHAAVKSLREIMSELDESGTSTPSTPIRKRYDMQGRQILEK